MRTLFCSLLLVASLLLAPTAMAWDTPVSKASLMVWEEVVEMVMGWFTEEPSSSSRSDVIGTSDAGPGFEPDGLIAGPGYEPDGVIGGAGYDPDGLVGGPTLAPAHR